MTKRTPLIAANWKMHGSLALVETLAASARRIQPEVSVEILLCPPAVFLPALAAALQGSQVGLGGQDVSEHDAGAYTGEIAAEMLKGFGCHYALVGHSERRRHHGESSELVARKAAAALRKNVIPVLCVGETLMEREAGQNWAVVSTQLEAARAVLEAAPECVLAYEPVWAIGTGRSASPAEAQEMHALIRGWLRGVIGERAERTRILYGGSVKADNVAALMAQPDVDGALVGGASLVAEEFAGICRNAG